VQESSGERFGQLRVAEFIERLASNAPVPGGGSASAVAGSLAASLVAMVAALSRNRDKYAAHAPMLAVAETESRELAQHLLDLADEDAAAYGEYAAALKLPRQTREELDRRKAATSDAARRATDVPLRCMETCVKVLATAEALAGRSNTNASSDLHVAALLAEAAGKGAAANVRINLPSVDDEEFIASTEAQVEELLRQIATLAESTRTVVLSGESREPLELAATASR
jgi:formiminotetrahydrofolate cyclodeaminase